jgi:hypothetical protein
MINEPPLKSMTYLAFGFPAAGVQDNACSLCQKSNGKVHTGTTKPAK